MNRMIYFVIVLLMPLNSSANDNIDCYDEIGAMLRGSIVAFRCTEECHNTEWI